MPLKGAAEAKSLSKSIAQQRLLGRTESLGKSVELVEPAKKVDSVNSEGWGGLNRLYRLNRLFIASVVRYAYEEKISAHFYPAQLHCILCAGTINAIPFA
jgi:hypothetical protein